MFLQRVLRPIAIATATAAMTACTVVDRAVIATETGASRILGADASEASPPPPAVDPQALTWQKLAPERRDLDAAQIAIIDTDAKTGATRVALKLQPGENLPAFWQEAPQTYMVMKGVFIAEGVNGAGQMERIAQGPGTFVRVPSRMIQHLRAKAGDEAIMLVTIYGAWKPNFLDNTSDAAELQRASN
jgi:hypothetical protein